MSNSTIITWPSLNPLSTEPGERHYYHLRAERFRPVVTLLLRGAKYLEPFAPACMGVNVASLLDSAARCLAEVQDLGPDRVHEFDWSLVPKIEMIEQRKE
jgi:hypothetical protein